MGKGVGGKRLGKGEETGGTSGGAPTSPKARNKSGGEGLGG